VRLKTLFYSFVGVGVLLLAACTSDKTLIVLLPDEGGASGTVTVETGTRTAVLDAPLTAARIGSQGSITKDVITPQDVERHFAQALAAQPPAPISFTLYFKEGSTEVMAESRATLEALFAEVARRQAVEVQVTGHTDRTGTDEENDRLSLLRAQAVQQMLLQLGLQASVIRAVGRGEREPLIPTPDEQPEPRNRRVEVIVR